MILLSDKIIMTVLLICCNALRIHAVFTFISIFFKERSKIFSYIAYLGYLFFNSLVVLIWGNPILNLLSNFIFIFLETIIYQAKWRTRIFVTLIVFSVSTITENIIAALFKFDLNIFSSIITVFISSVILFSMVTYVNSHMNSENQKVTSIFHAFIICSISAITIFVVMIMTLPDLQDSHFWIGIGMILLLLLNFLTIYLYDSIRDRAKQIQDKELLKQQNILYIKQYDTIYQNQKHIRLLRHDMKGHISTIKKLLETGNADEALNHINNMYDFLLINKDSIDSGNITIDSILNTKIQEASSNGIQIKSTIKVPSHLNIVSFDLSAILVNLLDNAITAVKKLNNKSNNSISISLELDRGILYIRISNPYNGDLMFEKNGIIKTTHHDVHHHGFGLESVNKTVERYDGCFHLKQDGSIFTVNVLLYNIPPITSD